MKKYAIVFNPLANNGKCEDIAKNVCNSLNVSSYSLINIFDCESYKSVMESLPNDVDLVIVGGDGTLNTFINDVRDYEYDKKIFYYPAGSGNDFWNDIKPEVYDYRPYRIDKYLKKLPEITVNGMNRLFLNGIGYGIDGYACEEADRQREKTNKKINYTTIAIKGLVYDYKPTNAKIVVDGVEHEYKDVWMAPAMNGRFFGGGMMATPMQDRLNEENTVTAMVLHDAGRLWILKSLPNVFTGKHVKYEKKIDFFTCHEVTVSFDRPVALQIDGETVYNVNSYTVKRY